MYITGTRYVTYELDCNVYIFSLDRSAKLESFFLEGKQRIYIVLKNAHTLSNIIRARVGRPAGFGTWMLQRSE